MRLRHTLRCCCLARVLGLTLRNGWTSADCVGRFGQVKTELQGTAYGPCLRGNQEHPPGPDGWLEKKVAWPCEAIEGLSRVP